MTAKHPSTFILDIDDTARIVRDGRTVIAICANQVIRAGHPEDIERELDARKSLPPKLQSWCPEIYEVIRHDEYWAICESKHAPSESPEKLLKKWDASRKGLWQQELWHGSLESALRLICPHRPVDVKKWAHSLKLLKRSGVSVPIPVQASKIREICRQKHDLTWHRGWVHGGLLAGRIRDSVFICWRNAHSEGRRGEDIARWVAPEIRTDPDVLLHVIKAVWQTDPLRAAKALSLLNATDPIPSRCFLTVNAHLGIPPTVVEKIMGCSTGEQVSWKAARAIYRTRNLQIGGVPFRVSTRPEIKAQRDDAFFIQRKRRPQDLFSLYSQGIQLDEEGRYSLTPERHAMTIAKYFRSFVQVLDACCGCGGNAIALARTGLRVVAMDSHVERLSMARQNARIYGVEERIKFLNDSFPKYIGGTDAIFLDPPWSFSKSEIKSWWKWAEDNYSHGMIKLPKDFPVSQQRILRVFCTQEGYPSFISVGWGQLANAI